MTPPPLTIRPARPGDTAVVRPVSGRVVMAELNGVPLSVVAVDGAALRADPVARAEHAVSVLLRHKAAGGRA